MIRCDTEGVPMTVQFIAYSYPNHLMYVVYFDGQKAKLEPPSSIGLLSKRPGNLAMFQAEREAEQAWVSNGS